MALAGDLALSTPKNKKRRVSPPPCSCDVVEISGGAEGRSAGSGWPAPARKPRSTDGSTAPGCWPLPRWCRPSVRLDDPVCSTLIRFLLKSWRICTTERFEPSAEAWVRSVLLAALSLASAALADELSRKSVPEVSEARPRPAALKVTPLNVQGGLAGFVEGQLEIVAVQQVDAIERCVLRRRRDLRDDVIVLLHQARANGLRSRIGNRRLRRRHAKVAVPARYSADRNRTDRGRLPYRWSCVKTSLLVLSRAGRQICWPTSAVFKSASDVAGGEGVS